MGGWVGWWDRADLRLAGLILPVLMLVALLGSGWCFLFWCCCLFGTVFPSLYMSVGVAIRALLLFGIDSFSIVLHPHLFIPWVLKEPAPLRSLKKKKSPSPPAPPLPPSARTSGHTQKRRYLSSRSGRRLPGGARSNCSVSPQVWRRFGCHGRRVFFELGDVFGAGGGPANAGGNENGSAVPGTGRLHHRRWPCVCFFFFTCIWFS